MRPARQRWRRGLNLETFAFEDTGLGPVGQSYDLLGADCGYTRAAYQECIVPFFASDKDGLRKSLNWEKRSMTSPRRWMSWSTTTSPCWIIRSLCCKY